ncbi:MAG: class I SAM-dependent methyltransferase [Polyangiaceae bacterium]
MSARDQKIGPTAHYTAFVWHRLGMPYAEHFATRRGRVLFWSFRLAGEWVATLLPRHPTMEQYLEIRHRTLEQVLRDAKPDRVVELGAGLSRRGLTWAADHGVDYTELDLPHMAEAKRNAIEARLPERIRRRVQGRLRQIGLDVLAEDFSSELSALLQGARRPVVLAEGLLGYFPMHERRVVVSHVCRALSAVGGGTFACDLRAREGGTAVAVGATALRGAVWLVTRGRGLRPDFATHDEIREFFADAGFDSAEPMPYDGAVHAPVRIWRCEVRGA